MMKDKGGKFKKKVLFKIILIILILVSVLIISFIFVRKINKSSENLISSRRAVQAALMRIESKAGFYKEYEKAKPYIEEMQGLNFLVEKEDVVKIFSFLEKTAQDTDNKQEIQLKESQPASNISALGTQVEKMNYTITLYGTYDSFIKYAEKIKGLPYYIKIDYINMYGPVDLAKSSQTVLGASFYIKK